MQKTPAELIDELCVTNEKIYHLIDKIIDDTHTRKEARQVQNLNKYRSQLKNAINEYFKERQEVKV